MQLMTTKDTTRDVVSKESEPEIVAESYGIGKTQDTVILESLKSLDHDLGKSYSENLISEISTLDAGTDLPESGLTPLQCLVAFCVANGMPANAIGEYAGVTGTTVSRWTRSHAAFRTRVSEIRGKMGLAMVSDKFEAIALRATEVAQEIMEDDEVNPSTRLQAAIHFIEQTRGKAPQKIEHKDNLLQTLLSKIDSDSERVAVERYVGNTRNTPEDSDEPN